MVCGLASAALMALLALSCAACFGGSATAPQKHLTLTPVTSILPPESNPEAMCFDRLDKTVGERNSMAFSMLQCAQLVETLVKELKACEARGTQEFHVMPYDSLPQALPGATQDDFVF